MARVVVVGGGYGGITAAKGLDPLAEVILVEQKDQFVHHAAALRAAVDDVWNNTIFMPYSYLLRSGKVLRGTVSKIDGTTVHVYGQDPIEADYLVLATGSTYPFPAKVNNNSVRIAKNRIDAIHSSLAKAKSALVIGGGTVGLELVGELASTHPDMKIHLVERGDDILHTVGYTDEFRNLVLRQLEDFNVELHTGAELKFLPPTPPCELGRFEVSTTKGETIEGDIWFQAYGAAPATGYLLGTDYADVLNLDNSVQVLPTMQIVGHPNTYAIGDITDVPESKRADAARHQARVAVTNIASQIEGEEPALEYKPTKEWVIVPLGPEHGASQLLDKYGNTRVVGAEETAEIKGTDLMVSIIRSQLNLP